MDGKMSTRWRGGWPRRVPGRACASWRTVGLIAREPPRKDGRYQAQVERTLAEPVLTVEPGQPLKPSEFEKGGKVVKSARNREIRQARARKQTRARGGHRRVDVAKDIQNGGKRARKQNVAECAVQPSHQKIPQKKRTLVSMFSTVTVSTNHSGWRQWCRLMWRWA